MTLDLRLVRRILMAVGDGQKRYAHFCPTPLFLEGYEPEAIDRHVRILSEEEVLVAMIDPPGPVSDSRDYAVPLGLTPRGSRFLEVMRHQPIWETACEIAVRRYQALDLSDLYEIARWMQVRSN